MVGCCGRNLRLFNSWATSLGFMVVSSLGLWQLRHQFYCL